jgi:hypothetical protein
LLTLGEEEGEDLKAILIDSSMRSVHTPPGLIADRPGDGKASVAWKQIHGKSPGAPFSA